MFQEYDFEGEFNTDEEVEEMLDAIVSEFGEQAVAEDNKTSIVNPYKIQQVLYTYKVLKYLTKGTGAKVSYDLYSPFKSMGSVTVTGKNLLFKKTEWFMKAVELSSNFEVYPKTDGTVEMNFTFHGLTKTIE